MTLTRERLQQLLHYEQETGVFTRRHSRGCAKAGTVAGCPSRGYLLIQVDGRLYPAHVLAWLYMHGFFPTFEIDHRDTNRSNNAIGNLRDVKPSINQQNRRSPSRTNKTGFLGVVPFRGKFKAQITVAGTNKHIGYFETAALAHSAYLEVKRKVHEGCTL